MFHLDFNYNLVLAKPLVIISSLTSIEHPKLYRLSEELELPANQLLALFVRCIKKLSAVLANVIEQGVESR